MQPEQLNCSVLSSMFEVIVKENLDKTAIAYAEDEYSYAQVGRDSIAVATYLQQLHLIQNDVIAIFNDKSYSSYILMLACIKIGVAYTNIDPNAPEDWVLHILSIAKPKKIFSDVRKIVDRYKSQGLCGLYVESTDDILREGKGVQQGCYQECQVDEDTIAYIMFTSGSTGKPKGVAISHRSVANFIRWSISRYSINQDDVFANVSPMFFDNSVFDFYSAFFSGACIAPIKQILLSQPKALVEYVDRMGCTIWFSVPSLLIYLTTTKVLRANNFQKVRVISFGGEAYPKTELKKIYDLYSSKAQFVNVYGPTECTCICSSYNLSDSDFEDLSSLASLGKINPEVSYIILNDQDFTDVDGELCLSGPNLAEGYYNDGRMTNRCFVTYDERRIYRSGDLVSERNGLLYFVGRKDNQIKHLGYRVELEAIEIAMSQFVGVSEVAVVYVRVSEAFGRIVAYMAPAELEDKIEEMRTQLEQRLPHYMLPHRYFFLQQLPKNANGKIYRAALQKQFLSSMKTSSQHVL